MRIDDMLQAIERIEEYLGDSDKENFAADGRTVDAIVRNLEILGEAARRIPPFIAQKYPNLPWARLAEMRNILVHEYHSVPPDLIRATALHDLPPLVPELRRILAEEA